MTNKQIGLQTKKQKRYAIDKTIFLIVSSEEEFEAYINKKMDKRIFNNCVNLCLDYNLIYLFNELAENYKVLLDEIVQDGINEVDMIGAIPEFVERDMEKWFENFKI